MKHKLSVVIIAKNEETVIEEAVRSSRFAHEVLVVDSGSTDKTVQLAKQLGARIEHQDWLGFGRQKQRAVELAANDWVFVLDCDERITEELRAEVLGVLENPMADGFHVPRLNEFFGKYVKYGGLYPDFSIRLFDRNKGRFNDADVHEKVQVDGKTGRIKNHLLHLAYDTIEDFIDNQNRYSSLQSKGRHLGKAILHSHWTFISMYGLKLGLLDGWRGFIIARLYAQYTFWKYIKDR